MACLLGVIPALIYAYEYGPDAGYTGAPGDNKTACIAAGCHAGTVNEFKGSVAITVAGGNTYTPGGGAQQISVTVADPAMKNWGFEMTARLSSETSKTSGFTQAGDFEPLNDGFTQVICNDDSAKPAGKACNASFPLQYVEHTLAGNVASTGPNSYTFKMTWTPPATNVGSIVLYAAGNASNGSRNSAAGHIYTSNITLTPAASTTGTKPAITSNGVVNGATFTNTPLSANTYITIGGTNLAANTRQWGDCGLRHGGQPIADRSGRHFGHDQRQAGVRGIYQPDTDQCDYAERFFNRQRNSRDRHDKRTGERHHDGDVSKRRAIAFRLCAWHCGQQQISGGGPSEWHVYWQGEFVPGSSHDHDSGEAE